MGTPQFSVPTLERLLADRQFEVVAVYTREPKIANRGHKLTNSPIHQVALKHGLKVLTPKTLRDSEIQKEFKNFNADAAVVVAYGLILPTEILQGTKFGCVNIHPSLLPKWRGAAPIQRTIMNGDKETAMTIIKMDEGLDSGDMICQEKFALNGDETYQSLAEKFSVMGAEILIKCLKKIDQEGGIKNALKQDDSASTYAHKIEKSECLIDWKLSAEEISQKIRGLSGSLSAYFEYGGEKIKIFSARILPAENAHLANPGDIFEEKFLIKCGDRKLLQPLILQRPGKNAMSIDDFLRGRRG